MQRLPQQTPSISKIDPHTFIVRLRQRHTILRLHPVFQIRKHLISICPEILCPDRDPNLLLICRIFQIGQYAGNRPAFLFQPCRLDNDFCRQVRSIIQEIVFLQSSMPRGFDGKLAVRTCAIQLDRFIDHIFISSFVTQMIQPQVVFQKLCQLSAGNTVCHYSRARMILRYQSGCHSYDAVSCDFTPLLVHSR